MKPHSSLGQPTVAAIPNGVEVRSNEFGGGAAWRFGWRQAVIAAEGHVLEDKVTQTVSGDGPNPKIWDVRSGLEFLATPALAVRGGYIYRHVDRDELTAQNEYLSQTVTAGFGLHPVRASWTLEIGYDVYWAHSDYGDPTRARSSQQQGLARVRWVF